MKYRTTKNCEICGKLLKNVHNSTKYCDACSVAVNLYRSKISDRKRARREKELWNKLSSEEKLERMNLIAKKLLEEGDERAIEYEHYKSRKRKTKICCLCGEEYKGYGNNPEPLASFTRKCCDKCNQELVIPARMKHRKGVSK